MVKGDNSTLERFAVYGRLNDEKRKAQVQRRNATTELRRAYWEGFQRGIEHARDTTLYMQLPVKRRQS